MKGGNCQDSYQLHRFDMMIKDGQDCSIDKNLISIDLYIYMYILYPSMPIPLFICIILDISYRSLDLLLVRIFDSMIAISFTLATFILHTTI